MSAILPPHLGQHRQLELQEAAREGCDAERGYRKLPQRSRYGTHAVIVLDAKHLASRRHADRLCKPTQHVLLRERCLEEKWLQRLGLYAADTRAAQTELNMRYRTACQE